MVVHMLLDLGIMARSRQQFSPEFVTTMLRHEEAILGTDRDGKRCYIARRDIAGSQDPKGPGLLCGLDQRIRAKRATEGWSSEASKEANTCFLPAC